MSTVRGGFTVSYAATGTAKPPSSPRWYNEHHLKKRLNTSSLFLSGVDQSKYFSRTTSIDPTRVNVPPSGGIVGDKAALVEGAYKVLGELINLAEGCLATINDSTEIPRDDHSCKFVESLVQKNNAITKKITEFYKDACFKRLGDAVKLDLNNECSYMVDAINKISEKINNAIRNHLEINFTAIIEEYETKIDKIIHGAVWQDKLCILVDDYKVSVKKECDLIEATYQRTKSELNAAEKSFTEVCQRLKQALVDLNPASDPDATFVQQLMQEKFLAKNILESTNRAFEEATKKFESIQSQTT